MGEAPSVANFGEGWFLAYFALPSRYFGLLGGGELGSGTERSQFVEGRYLSSIPGEGGLQPIVCCQPARSGEGHFLAASPGSFLAVAPDLFLAVSSGSFSGCVAKVVAGCVAKVVAGCVARVVSGCVARVVTGCVARHCSLNFVSGFGSWLSWLCDSPEQ